MAFIENNTINSTTGNSTPSTGTNLGSPLEGDGIYVNDAGEGSTISGNRITKTGTGNGSGTNTAADGIEFKNCTDYIHCKFNTIDYTDGDDMRALSVTQNFAPYGVGSNSRDVILCAGNTAQCEEVDYYTGSRGNADDDDAFIGPMNVAGPEANGGANAGHYINGNYCTGSSWGESSWIDYDD